MSLRESVLNQSYRVAAPLAEVLLAHRDDLPAFAASLPGIRGATEELRATDGSTETRVHRWVGDASFLPAAAVAWVGEEHFAWVIRTRWTGEEGVWEISSPALGDEALLAGTHRFAADGGATVVTVGAELVG